MNCSVGAVVKTRS